MSNYILKRKLGTGAMGEVWLGEDTVLQRQVALKLIPAAAASDPERQKRFLREARLAAKLSHPNAVSVYQAGIENNSIFVVMELLSGEALDNIVRMQGALDWREATQIICDAARGLAAAHEIGLVHRDIKPANLMQTSKGVTKVVDFGLARESLSDTLLTQAGGVVGTPAFMSPEQWIGATVDARSDLYSLICTYYFLLTGQMPFEAPSIPSLGYQHRYEPFPDPRQRTAGLPDAVCRILARGSQKNAADRYQTAGELIAALEALLATPNESLMGNGSWPDLLASVTNDNGASPVLNQPVSAAGARNRPVPIPIGIAGNRASPVVSPYARRKRQALKSRLQSAALGTAAGVVVLLGIVLYVRSDNGTIKIELSDPGAQVAVKSMAITWK